MTRHPLRRAGAVLVALLAGLLALIATAPAASAAAPPDTNTVISAWKSGDPLYVGPGAALSSGQQSDVREALEDATTKIYVAALADGTFASEAEAGAYLKSLSGALEREGRPLATVAVLDGTTLFAYSTATRGISAGRLANLAAAAHPGDLSAGMADFIERVDLAAQGRGRTALNPEPVGGSGGGGAGVLIGLLVLFLVGGFGVFFYSRKKKREREARAAAELAAVKKTVDEDVTTFGEEITALDAEVRLAEMRLTDAQRADNQRDWQKALDSYEKAKAELAAVKHPEELRAVTSALEAGRFALACVKARIEGRPLPEHRAPCFFNPQHGPSVRDVTWAPPGGAPRPVPACAADAQRIEQGFDPEFRMVEVYGHRRPYYDAGPAYAPYAYGYYGGFGDIMTGMLIGTMIGSMLTPSFGGYGMGYSAGYQEGMADAGGWGGGDFGGGWGGGDWSGGDFGGGDFGGDW